MAVDQHGKPDNKLQGRTKERSLPHWVRPVTVIAAVFFLIIAVIIWLWKIWGDLSAMISALFTFVGVIAAVLAIPGFYKASDAQSSTAESTVIPFPPFPPPSTPPISITVSPVFSLTPNQPGTAAEPLSPVTSEATAAPTPLPVNMHISPQQQPDHYDQHAPVKPPQSLTQPVFFVNAQLKNPEEFHGRTLERTTLLQRTHHGDCTSLVGPRRIGKTWLLKYLQLIAKNKLADTFQIGYIDVTLPSCSTVKGFTGNALAALGHPRSMPENPDLHTLETFVKEYIDGGRTPILCIDEFEGFIHHKEFTRDFFTHLRSIAGIGLCLVTASQKPLIEIVSASTKTSPFFNIFLQLSLKPFDKGEARAFVRAKGIQAGFTQQEQDYLIAYGQQEDAYPPLRLQCAGDKLLQKKQASATDPDCYRPEQQDFWLAFSKELEEVYRAVVL